MITHGKTIISDDLKEQMFHCDIEKCKGACCVEGDLGAPVEEDELPILREILEDVKPYLSPAGIKALEEQGAYVLDHEGDYSTPTIGGKECAYAIYDEQGILKCGIEQAYFDGKTSFRKPVSCHLYPVRINSYEEFDALNYDRWSICSPACTLGDAMKMPVYKFVKEALIRKYGPEWYAGLERKINEEKGLASEES